MRRIRRDVSKWHLWLHRDARSQGPARPSDSARERVEDELFDRLFAGEGEGDALEPDPADPSFVLEWADGVHKAATELPEFGRLAERCRGDDVAAALAVEGIARALGDKMQPSQKPDARDQRAKDFAMRRALRIAVAKAGEDVDELEEVRFGLSSIVGTGSEEGEGRTKVDGELVRRLRGDARLRRIAALAGRMKRIASAKRRQRVRHGADEISDVGMGADLARLLPSELGKLRHPRMRLLLFRSLLERAALQYELSGTEAKGKGPIVLLVDKSGSMDGERDEWATAVALALMETAHSDKRTFAFVAFNGSAREPIVVRPGGTLPMDALSVGCGGGTNVDSAVEAGLRVVESEGGMRDADLVLITDGASGSGRAEELKERARGLKCSTFGVGIQTDKDSLLPWCDDAQAIETLGMGEALSERLFG